MIGESKNLEILSIATHSLCLNYSTACHFSKIIDIAPTAVKLFEKEGKEYEYFGLSWPPYALICGVYGMSLGFTGKFEKGLVFIEKGLNISGKINNLLGLSSSEWLLGMIYVVKGDCTPAIEHLKNSIAHGEQINYPFATIYATTYLALAYCLLGDLELALETSEKSIRLAKESGIERLLLTVYRVSSKIHYVLEDYKRAITDANESLRVSQKGNHKFYEGLSLIDLGNALWRLEASKIEEAEKFILQGIDMLNEFNARPFVAQGYLDLGEFYTNSGQVDIALITLKKTEAMFKEMGMDYYLIKTHEIFEKL
jgi:tetratricopeptide (TPR) repeat protein